MRFHRYEILVTSVASSVAVAADMLPLARGIYVRAEVACRGASNVDTMSYWGEDNGLNLQRVSCRIDRLSRDGSVYIVHRQCRELRHGGTFSDRVRVTVLSRTSFSLNGRTFRFCGSTVQF